jgi:hypothetical protein
MKPRLVTLQTQNAHGSWVTPRDASGHPLQFPLCHATLRHLELCPANARLVCAVSGEELVTKQNMLAFTMPAMAREPQTQKPRRPMVFMRGPGHHTPIVIPAPKNHIKSWWGGTISPGRTHVTGPRLEAIAKIRFEPPKKRVSAR